MTVIDFKLEQRKRGGLVNHYTIRNDDELHVLTGAACEDEIDVGTLVQYKDADFEVTEIVEAALVVKGKFIDKEEKK